MSFKREVFEKVDYGAVINFHLNRVAEARSNLPVVKNLITPAGHSLSQLNRYFYAVDTLRAILLPNLRGGAERYLRAAREALNIIDLLEDSPNPEEEERLRGALEELKRKFGTSDPLKLIDKALEEMLTKLNEAGLLLRDRWVAVGGYALDRVDT